MSHARHAPTAASQSNVQKREPTGSVPISPRVTQLKGMTFDQGEALLSPSAEGSAGLGPSGGGSPLPEATRMQMERSLGSDFSSVRVHQGGQAGALGARAFAQGESIHFAPGAYAPGSASGDALIGHELAHVVQQRAGRVSPGPQGKGGAINSDRGLEAEADRAGAAAARGAGADMGGATGRAASGSDAPIQGNFGFEVEVGGMAGWRVMWDKPGGPMPKRGSVKEGAKPENKPDLPPKGFAIAARDGYQMQAEDNGNERTIEFVSNAPGFATGDEVEKAAGSVESLASRLAARNGKEPFNASRIGGTPGILMKPGSTLTGELQATAGVPLASLPSLMKGLAAKGWGGAGQMRSAVAHTETSGAKLNELMGGQASPELQGFLTMLRLYIDSGKSQGTKRDGTRQRRSFPKGQFALMARTDFNKMFRMLPQKERETITQKMKQWIAIVTDNLDQHKPVSNAIYNYDETWETDGTSISTTRKSWLEDMPQKDRLSLAGHESTDVKRAKEPAKKMRHSAPTKDVRLEPLDTQPTEELAKTIEGLYEGIGAYGHKTDTVKYEGKDEGTEAVILELRSPAELGDPSSWKKGIMDTFGVVTEAIKNPHGTGQGENVGFENVQSEKQLKLKSQGEKIERQIKAERVQRQLEKVIGCERN